MRVHARQWQPKSGSSYARRREGRLSGRLFSFEGQRNNAEPDGLAEEARLILAPSPSALIAPRSSPILARGFFFPIMGMALGRLFRFVGFPSTPFVAIDSTVL
jgi:hypothetical protein